jgi:hypothetical protein
LALTLTLALTFAFALALAIAFAIAFAFALPVATALIAIAIVAVVVGLALLLACVIAAWFFVERWRFVSVVLFPSQALWLVDLGRVKPIRRQRVPGIANQRVDLAVHRLVGDSVVKEPAASEALGMLEAHMTNLVNQKAREFVIVERIDESRINQKADAIGRGSRDPLRLDKSKALNGRRIGDHARVIRKNHSSDYSFDPFHIRSFA